MLKQGEIENSFLARMTPEQDELFLNWLARRIASVEKLS
jgi:hypothetical protein